MCFILINSCIFFHMNFFTFHMIWNLMIQKRQVTTQKKKEDDIEAWLNQVPNIHILRRNPTSRRIDFKTTQEIGWVHPKFTHAHPLAWGNNKHDVDLKLSHENNILYNVVVVQLKSNKL